MDKPDKDDVVVICRIPREELLSESPVVLRQELGEKVYATALRKAGM